MFLYRVFRLILKLLFKILFNLQVCGKENIPHSGGYIVASNHASYLDPICVGIAFPKPLHFMAREDLFSIKLLGPILRSIGVFALRRDTADRASIKKALKSLMNGEGLALFPEGTRTSNGSIKSELKKGVGLLAYNSKSPIIPVYIQGSNKILPRNSRFIKFGHTIKVYIGKSIDCDEFKGINTKDAYSRIADKVRDSLIELAKLYNI